MKITRDTAYREQLLENQRLRMGIGSRRSGVHVSDLVFCVRKAQQERKAQFTEEVDDGTILTWLRGLSHEALLSDGVEQVRSGFCFQCMKNHPWTPELAIDSKCPDCGDELLVGTIDWVTLEGLDDDTQTIDNFIPVEMKSTLKSSRKTLEEGDMAWFVDQIKSYMFMQGRKEGRVCILHVMGDYSRGNPDIKTAGPKADLRVYKIEWDNDEEALAWGQELQWSKEDVQGDTLPELNERSPRHDFICEYCIIGKRLPSTGEPCELYPWTADGIRKGSALAGSITADTLDEMLKGIAKIEQSESQPGQEPQPAPEAHHHGPRCIPCSRCNGCDQEHSPDCLTFHPTVVIGSRYSIPQYNKGGKLDSKLAPTVTLAGVKLTPEQQKALAESLQGDKMPEVRTLPPPPPAVRPALADVERAAHELQRIVHENERERQRVLHEATEQLARQLQRSGELRDADPTRTGSSQSSTPGEAGSTTGDSVQG